MILFFYEVFTFLSCIILIFEFGICLAFSMSLLTLFLEVSLMLCSSTILISKSQLSYPLESRWELQRNDIIIYFGQTASSVALVNELLSP